MIVIDDRSCPLLFGFETRQLEQPQPRFPGSARAWPLVNDDHDGRLRPASPYAISGMVFGADAPPESMNFLAFRHPDA